MLNQLRAIWILLLLCTTAHAQFQADPHSYSQPNQVIIDHLILDLTINFEDKVLTGFTDLHLKRLNPEVKSLMLDSRDLNVKQAQANIDGEWVTVEHKVGEVDAILGAPINIRLPEGADKVRVYYESRPEASGLQWLTPAQTAGKKQPFLFSQSQAIHARSWVPLQDTPQVRFTYAATIRTPEGLKAVMSADNDSADQDGVYEFRMLQRIPSYLMAIAAGELQFKAMSKRTAVYAERSILEAAAAEFEDTEAMMEAVEKRFGPYQWGRYDLLILPPSFPFGGMENPRLSFITPTVIAGDKSLVSLIAHELAHSWSGNLVTNSVWSDLWLNEGFTTYLEGRIVEDVFGVRRSKMEAVLGYQDLLAELESLDAEDSRLALKLTGRDPDEVFSSVPYEKGRWFLTWLEHSFGREHFDQWLKGYFSRHAFQSINTQGFIQDIQEFLLKKYPDVVSLSEVQAWIHGEGLPEKHIIPESNAFVPIEAASSEWLAGKRDIATFDVSDWTTHEWLFFLNKLEGGLTVERMAALDKQFDLTDATNNEIAHVWLKLSIQNDYQPAFSRLKEYLIGIGRRKLIVPLYEALVGTKEGAELARHVYQQARPGYHPLAQSTIDAIVKD